MDEYNRILFHEGLPLSQINPGSTEYALSADAALRAIGALEGTAIAILGGDVLTENDGKLAYTESNWFCNKQDGSCDQEYAVASRAAAAEYISRYEATTGARQHALYVLVIQD
jgi:hypothetical protein